MTQSKTFIAVSLGIISLIAAGCISPLRQPEARIQASLLQKTPLGETSQEVKEYVEKRGWLDHSYLGNTGFLKQETGSRSVELGTTSIQGNLGHYWSWPVFRTDVTAFWGFDGNGRLIDIWVWKTTDGF